MPIFLRTGLATPCVIVLLAAEGSLGSAGDLASTDFLALVRILGSLATTQGLGWHSIQ